MTTSESNIEGFGHTLSALKDAISKAIVGQEKVVEEVLFCLFAGGHVLLEGAPGLGKTLLVRSLGQALSLDFSRIQFTPDLMPSDIVGTQMVVEDAGRKRFELQRGPIFGQIVLADEVNRATPKTQSALLEAMGEGSVTIAGEHHALDQPFFVLATENPIEMEGTYPLPEAQLDRFLFKVLVPSPDENTLVSILERTTGTQRNEVPKVMDGPTILAARELVRQVRCAEPIVRYVARLIGASDPSDASASASAKKWLRYGPGVRGAQGLLLSAKVAALSEGRAHVSYDDITRVLHPTLRHRLIPSFEAEAEGVHPDSILDAIAAEVPRASEGVRALG